MQSFELMYDSKLSRLRQGILDRSPTRVIVRMVLNHAGKILVFMVFIEIIALRAANYAKLLALAQF